jgi:hypothetical protein
MPAHLSHFALRFYGVKISNEALLHVFVNGSYCKTPERGHLGEDLAVESLGRGEKRECQTPEFVSLLKVLNNMQTAI